MFATKTVTLQVIIILSHPIIILSLRKYCNKFAPQFASAAEYKNNSRGRLRTKRIIFIF